MSGIDASSLLVICSKDGQLLVYAILGEHGGALKVAVTQAPQKGQANQAIARLLCESLSLKRSQVYLLAGETSSRKRFLIRDLTVEQLSARLQTLLSH